MLIRTAMVAANCLPHNVGLVSMHGTGKESIWTDTHFLGLLRCYLSPARVMQVPLLVTPSKSMH